MMMATVMVMIMGDDSGDGNDIVVMVMVQGWLIFV